MWGTSRLLFSGFRFVFGISLEHPGQPTCYVWNEEQYRSCGFGAIKWLHTSFCARVLYFEKALHSIPIVFHWRDTMVEAWEIMSKPSWMWEILMEPCTHLSQSQFLFLWVRAGKQKVSHLECKLSWVWEILVRG